jgi:hypothetical protein
LNYEVTRGALKDKEVANSSTNAPKLIRYTSDSQACIE